MRNALARQSATLVSARVRGLDKFKLYYSIEYQYVPTFLLL